MMTASVKYLEGTKWHTMALSEINGQSIIGFMKTSHYRLVAALMKDGVPVIFICNHKEDFETYQKKGPTFVPEQLGLLVWPIDLPLLEEIFPGSSFEYAETKAA